MKQSRRGISILEVTTAALMMTVLVVAVTSLIGLGIRYQRFAREQMAARIELSNIAEQLQAIDYTDLSSGPAPVPLTSEAQQALGTPEATLSVVELKAPSGKRITIRIRWSRAHECEVSLTTWRYEPVEGAEL